MKLYAPKYFPNFKCIGGKCTKNCCIGWEIVIDDDTLSTYQTLDGKTGKAIRGHAYKSHILNKKTTKRLRHLRAGGTLQNKAEAATIRSLIPYK